MVYEEQEQKTCWQWEKGLESWRSGRKLLETGALVGICHAARAVEAERDFATAGLGIRYRCTRRPLGCRNGYP